MKTYTDFNAEWLQWIAPEKFNDADLFRIVTFFVFHSPCPELSSMGKPLSAYNWNKPWSKPFYLNRQLRQAASTYDLLFSASTYENMSEALSKANLLERFPDDIKTERICIYDKMRNQFLSVFYHIRNAFAHCRLNMVDVDGECYFVMEDIIKENKKDGLCRQKVTARMILRKTTLLNWIDIIEAGEKEFSRNE